MLLNIAFTAVILRIMLLHIFEYNCDNMNKNQTYSLSTIINAERQTELLRWRILRVASKLNHCKNNEHSIYLPNNLKINSNQKILSVYLLYTLYILAFVDVLLSRKRFNRQQFQYRYRYLVSVFILFSYCTNLQFLNIFV